MYETNSEVWKDFILRANNNDKNFINPSSLSLGAMGFLYGQYSIDTNSDDIVKEVDVFKKAFNKMKDTEYYHLPLAFIGELEEQGFVKSYRILEEMKVDALRLMLSMSGAYTIMETALMVVKAQLAMPED